MTDANPKKPRIRPRPVELDAAKVDPKAAPTHFERWEGRILAVDARDVVASNFSVTRALVVVLGAMPNLLAARSLILSTLTDFNVAALDDLTSLAYAAWSADLQQRTVTDPSQSCADLMPETESLRSLLLASALSQVKRGNIPQSVIDAVLPGSGIEDRANDLAILAAAFRKAWKAIDGRTDVTLSELDRAEELSLMLLARLALRSVPTQNEDKLDPAQVRARALTLLSNAYEECRRGLAAIWWYEPGGWEQYVPSLRSGQGGRGARGASPSDEPVPPPEEPVPPTPAVPGAPPPAAPLALAPAAPPPVAAPAPKPAGKAKRTTKKSK